MLLLKANSELKSVFQKLIKTMNQPVTWTEIFVIMNNTLILAGDVRSLIFNFDNKKAYTSIIEIPEESAQLERMPNDSLLSNVMNITLYSFGKWGVISGLKVDKDYDALNSMFKDVLRPINAEPDFSVKNFRFFKDDIQITYEDIMLAVLKLLKKEGKLREGQSLATSETKPKNKKDSENDTKQDNAKDAQNTARDFDDEEDEYEIGLWHTLSWKKETCEFQKESRHEEDSAKSRIGNNFYITNYLCPKCQQKLYMGVYPVDKELLIETEEGRVFMARTYACHTCNAFYTPRPKKLLQEGDVYSIKFDEDRTAYEDYLEVLGKYAERTTNHRFNEFESERAKKTETDTEFQTDMESKADTPPSRTPDNKKERKEHSSKSGKNPPFQNRKERNTKTGNTDYQKSAVETLSDTPAFNSISYTERGKEPSRAEFSRADSAQNSPAGTESELQKQIKTRQAIARLSGKTTDELKAILTDLERRSETAGGGTNAAEAVPDAAYVDAVRETLHSKLTAKYDARMNTLAHLSPKQLTDLKKQVEKEAALSDEQKKTYTKKLNGRLYQAEESALAQKVELSKNKSYAEIERIIEDVEKRDVPDELKQETLAQLKQIKAKRAKQEVEHLLSHIPLHLDRKQLSTYIAKVGQYKEVDITPYREQLEQRKDMAEKEELSMLVKRGGKKDRNALWNLYEQIQQQDYKEENKAPFLEKIYEKIRRMDEQKIEQICPSITSLSFADGLKVYEQISEGMFLPELKTNTLEMIQRRLTKLKSDESVQLMRKLKHDLEEKSIDCERFYFYDAREELKLAQREADMQDVETDEAGNRNAMLRAINGYASARDTYEYPLVVCDISRTKNGKEGFVLTPDHIFFRTFLNSGVISIPDIEAVQANKSLFNKGVFVKCTNGRKEKLPNHIKAKNWNDFAKVFDDFMTYLQEKPESRSLEYLAKERHDVKCCYRCGFVYKSGNVCPKCGSKMNH